MKKPFLTVTLLLLSFLSVFAQNNIEEKQWHKVDSLLNSYYQPGTPGIAMAIIKKGKTVYSNQIGLADMEYGIPITDSTVFHIASVSKQFTAFLAVLLEKEGKLSMEDDLRQHLPELKQLPYKITLRQLANHTHGLPNLFELARLRGIGIEDRMTHREVVQMLLNIKKINFKPGDKYEYNNTGYVLLAEVIERIIGKPFQEILKDRIFTPLGMMHSMAVDNSSLIVKNKAHSYRLTNGEYENYAFNIMVNGSSGISTTINDLSKWAINFQHSENQEIFQEMQEKTTLNSGKARHYGLGLEFKDYKGLKVVFHGGGDAGYRSYILHVPEHRFSIVLLGNNNDFTPLKIVYETVDLLLKEYQKEPLSPKKVNYTTQELKRFEGTYKMFPGTYFNITAENDTLYFQSYGTHDKAPLPVIGDGDFLFPYIPTSKFSFYENGFNFHIADFKYDCKKVKLNAPKSKDINLIEYTGIYKSTAFNTVYELVIKNNQLIAVHSFNDNIDLHPLSKDRFYSNKPFFGTLDFVKNEKGKIIEFQLSGQNLNSIKFKKIY
ncbi:class A beta-lactamase-related serine hydrolase [Sinomicrobium pectinilyticum]|uniref:Class A beta-lactamase-related serine hydrolase n=1 Tax=Sinomicrobium pectinilyticum TaxID=1084421 RepID=A0A3N0EPW4_SINP1|nr:serine hydrolase domain-containing protein [Sinomicrobium pectinilyticum]RNL89841.1 class A beta-lactamase-related serine hydrolase [Sinomicrobium pectinilyticum]